ncbi:MAG: lactate utilization protein [Oscillospiraceae bacterium]|nr:lactate utilization protein [Oscillospiraceae bacterium]MBR5251385.1 lactate utilization protein [Oscillospiraceae bacterium]
MNTKIQQTIDALKRNQFDAFYAEDSAQALEIVKGLLKPGTTVDRGGSLTVEQTGVLDYIRSGLFNFVDPYTAPTEAQKMKLMESRFTCDTFLCSANAIISDGTLYNVDGACSRVAPMLFGPKQVIVIAGKNKIVDSEQEAKHRLQTVAAPANAKRLNAQTPCTFDGVCHECKHEKCICCSTVITRFNRVKGRIKVIIVNEDLGL